MIWQDMVFFAGNAFSVMVLAPTLRDAMSNVPLGTSVPSSVIGLVYGATFLTMGMTYSAAGSMLAGVMWGLIALLRAPDGATDDGKRAAAGNGAAATGGHAEPAD